MAKTSYSMIFGENGCGIGIMYGNGDFELVLEVFIGMINV